MNSIAFNDFEIVDSENLVEIGGRFNVWGATIGFAGGFIGGAIDGAGKGLIAGTAAEPGAGSVVGAVLGGIGEGLIAGTTCGIAGSQV
ncbi:hypothetical protein [Streptococcus sobrinus]|nr:hypothetical protein [Streptococcus sobrinus]